MRDAVAGLANPFTLCKPLHEKNYADSHTTKEAANTKIPTQPLNAVLANNSSPC